jgi:serine/threonine-protein kinase
MGDNGESTLSNGTVIKDRYTIVRLLGAGGMGAVYEAKDTVLDKRVALKILHKAIAQDEQMNARFIQEARAASAFKHRHVVESLDFGAHEGAPFLVMEFLEGESFADLLQRHKTITPERAVALLEPIARALSRAHQAGIIHRDVKPDNIYLAKGDHDDECVPKLVDFGIAKRTTEGELRLTKTSVAMGTPFYMPPEQAMGARDVTASADQYAFAAMLFEAVSGKFPHDGESYNALIINKVTKEPLALTEAAPGINPAFAAVVMKALSREPGARYRSMTELRDALVESVGGKVDRASSTGSLPVVRVTDRDASTAKALPIPAISASNIGETRSSIGVTSVGIDAPKAGIPADSVAGVERPSVLQPAPSSAKSNTGLIVGGLVALAVLGGGGFALSKRSAANASTDAPRTTGPAVQPQAPVARRTLRVRVTPETASIQVDGREVGRGNATFEAPAGTEVELRLNADGRVPRSERLRLDADQSIERVLEPLPSATTASDTNAAQTAAPTRTPTAGRSSGRGNSGGTRIGPLHLGRTGVSLDLNLGRGQ